MKKILLFSSLLLSSVLSFGQLNVVVAKTDKHCSSDSTGISANAWTTLPANTPSPLIYCFGYPTLPSEGDIGRVRFGAIDNSSSCESLIGTQATATGVQGKYSDFTNTSAPVATFQKGSSTVLTIDNSPCNWTGYYMQLALIDFNQNGDFTDAGETVMINNFSFLTNSAEVKQDHVVEIPMTALTGKTRMRIANVYGTTINNFGCGTFMCGEVEDYQINIDNETYTYTWAPATGLSSTTGQFVKANPSVQTTYTLTVMDINGNTTTSTVTVDPPSFSMQSTSVNPDCSTASGVISLSAVGGGVAPFSFTCNGNTITTSNTTQDFNGLGSGVYPVQIVDAAGCSQSSSLTITVPTALNTTVTSLTNVQCFGMSNGSISLNSVGATPPYTYYYNGNNIGSNTLNNLAGGSYVIETKDDHNCTSSSTFFVSEPSDLQVIPYGGPNTASLAVSGGTPNYTYSWTPGNYTTYMISGVSAGTYTATVTDAHGCSKSKTVQVVSPLGVENVHTTSDVYLYPNPVVNTLRVDYLKGIQTLEIFNLQGAKLLTQSYADVDHAQINLSSFAQGLYVVKVNHHAVSVFSKE